MRGQAHTLEAIVASLVLLTGLIFALQMTAVTPLSASTSSQHIENQQQSVSEGVLATAAERAALKPALLYWNNSSQKYHNESGTGLGKYASTPPNNTFGTMLERVFDERGIAYNVYFRYRDGGSQSRIIYLYNGRPSDNAVAASYTVTLMDGDHLYDSDGTQNETTLSEATGFPIPDRGANVYNTVRVEVVSWRI
ncbi:hypothetical protein EGH21_16045 [Halomicroarcula sp. F13]|uniref:Uncharacterized protein n=1 Tax=Haloarcula rubra TaxID=2487747 RepID=A0AAW4PTR1_9EURY|nr:hypothetical protein [Halomicroarcula rubra]MBX0324542.1 hypothetical protein [Halomicroarcula rubra]